MKFSARPGQIPLPNFYFIFNVLVLNIFHNSYFTECGLTIITCIAVIRVLLSSQFSAILSTWADNGRAYFTQIILFVIASDLSCKQQHRINHS